MMAQVGSLKTGVKYKDTPIGKIPVDWEVVKLGDVSEEIYRYPTYYNIKYVDQNQGVPEIRGELINNNGELLNDLSAYRHISNETSSMFPRTILHEGDFVLSVRGTMGKIGYVTSRLENANMTANLMRISPNRHKVYPLWMKHFFLSEFFQNRLEEASSATTIKTIKAPELKAIEIALPPLLEQKRIAEILTTVDEAIEKTELVIEKTKEVKKGLMQKLLSRGIGHKQFIKTEIGEIPEEWKVIRLRDITQRFYNGGTPDTKIREYWDGNIPWITGADFEDQKIRRFRRYITDEGMENSATNLIPKGNLLVVTRTGVGKLAIAPFDIAISQDITGVILDSKKALPGYIYCWLNFRSERLRSIIQGTSINGILREDLESIALPLPTLSEQEHIAAILFSVDVEIEKETNRREQLEVLKKGLMQVLLTGKIRVIV